MEDLKLETTVPEVAAMPPPPRIRKIGLYDGDKMPVITKTDTNIEDAFKEINNKVMCMQKADRACVESRRAVQKKSDCKIDCFVPFSQLKRDAFEELNEWTNTEIDVLFDIVDEASHCEDITSVNTDFEITKKTEILVSQNSLKKIKSQCNEVGKEVATIDEDIMKDFEEELMESRERFDEDEEDLRMVQAVERVDSSSRSTEKKSMQEYDCSEKLRVIAPLDIMKTSPTLKISPEFSKISNPSTSKPELTTNFVGFKSGLGRTIQIKERSLQTANNIFNDIINEIHTEETTVKSNENPEITGFKTGLGKPIKISNNSVETTKNIFDDILMEMNKETHSEQTKPDSDHRNPIQPSERISKWTKNNDLGEGQADSDVDFLQPKFEPGLEYCGFKTGLGKPVQLSEKSLKYAKKIFNDIQNEKPVELDVDIFKPNSPMEEFCGFKTGLGKPVHPSEKSLKYATNIFNDIQNEKVELDVDTFEPNSPMQEFCDFKTGLGKPVQLSEKWVKSVKNMFGDILNKTQADNEHENSKLNTSILSEFCSFKTGIRELAQPIEKSLKSANNLVGDIFNKMQTDSELENLKPISPAFSGFKTGLGKPVQPSEKSLKYSKNIFDDIHNVKQLDIETTDIEIFKPNSPVLTEPVPEFCGFKTGLGKPVKPSEKSLKYARNIFDDIHNAKQLDIETTDIEIFKPNSPVLTKPVPEFCGFKTGLGKQVKPSEKSLKYAKNIFDDIHNAKQLDIETTDIEIFKPNSPVLTKPVPEFCGFKTGLGKPVKPSEKSLKYAKNIFDDIHNAKQLDIETTDIEIFKPNSPVLTKPVPEFCGFKTGLGKPVQPSEKSLKYAKNIFDDIHNAKQLDIETTDIEIFKPNYPILTKPVPEFCGFKTGLGKSVQPSEKSLKYAKNIFDDIHNAKQVDIETTDIEIFQPNSSVLNSSVRNEFEDILNKAQDYELENLKPEFCAFKTGLGKPVQPSEEALKSTKNIFDGLLNEMQVDNELENSTLKAESRNEFGGFKTGLGNTVNISEKCLNSVKNIFGDILNDKQDNSDTKFVKPNSPLPEFCGFKTSLGNRIQISEKALNMTKNIFDEVESSIENANIIGMPVPEYRGFENKRLKLKSTRDLLEDILIESHAEIPKAGPSNFDGFNTYLGKAVEISEQPLKTITNNFDEVIKTATENHLKSPENINEETSIISPVLDTKRKQRSPSPILVCRKRPKKSRNTFRPPFSQTETRKHSKSETVYEAAKPVSEPKKLDYDLRSLYELKRTNCTYTLHDLENCSNGETYRNAEIRNVDAENAVDFRFRNARVDLTIESADPADVTLSDIEATFLKLGRIDPKLIPDGWVRNHFKWIAWKLASYELKFPGAFSRCGLTVRNVLEQLIYRYERELYLTQRPCLRKILESDDTPNKRMVLCVSKIIQLSNGVVKTSSRKSSYELVLTDGWYSITATLDPLLSAAVKNGKIQVGTKLMIQSAELLNCTQGVSPLEDISQVRLKISGNSTRRALWSTKLGFQKNPSPIPVKLRTVSPCGGKVSKLTVFIARVYPLFYLETLADGSKVTRSERMESVYATKYEMEKQRKMEKLYEDIEKEMAGDIDSIMEEYGGRGKGLDGSLARIAKSANSQGIQADVTPSQLSQLRNYHGNKRELVQQKIQDRIQDRLNSEQAGTVERQITPLLKVRIVDWNSSPDNNKRLDDLKELTMTAGILSIWRPSEGLLEMLKEGQYLDITNVFPTTFRLGECHLSANRQTSYAAHRSKRSSLDPKEEAIMRTCTDLAMVDLKDFNPPFSEIDTIGLIVFIEPHPGLTKPNYQIVYLADFDLNFLAVNFLSGLSAHGYEKYMSVGKCVACSNLQYRKQRGVRPIAQVFVSDNTVFSQFSNSRHLKEKLGYFKIRVSNIDTDAYVKKCQLEITNRLAAKNVRILRDVNSEDYHLTGLDFDSTVNEASFVRSATPKRPNDTSLTNADKKIKFLNFYKSPPALSPITLMTKRQKSRTNYPKPVRLYDPEESKTPKKDITKNSSYVAEDVDIFDDELQNYSPPLSLD